MDLITAVKNVILKGEKNMNTKEFEDFIGNKLDKLTVVFSFRITLKQAKKLSNKETIRISIKGKEFDLKAV